MKISYAEYIKKTSVAVLVAETLFNELLLTSEIKTIDDIANTKSGGTPLRSNSDYYGGKISWLKSGELNDGIIEKANEFITENGLKNSSAKLHPKGTLLVAMYGATAGKTGIINFEASTNQAVCAVFPKDVILNDYLFWFFRSHRYQFIEKSKGGAQPNISQTVIKKTIIPVPKTNIQKQIVTILAEIENKNTIDISKIPDAYKNAVTRIFNFKNSLTGISNELTHQLDLVKQLRQAFLREAMQGKLVEQDKTDEPATELLARIKAEKEQLIKEKKIKKQKPLPPIAKEEIPFEIPESWVWCRLGEIINFYSGNNFKSGDFVKNNGVKCIKITNAGIGKVIETEDRLPFEYIDKYSNYLVYENDLVIALTRPYIADGLKISKCSNSYNNSLLNQRVAVLRSNKKINNDFIYLYMRSGYVLSLYKSMFTDKGQQPNLRKDHVTDLQIPLPPLSEQKRIVAKLDELMAYCDSLEESIKNSQAQNEMLLQQVLREALEPKEKKSVG